MAKIRPVTKFEYKGKLYDSSKKAIEANEEEINNLVGKMINTIRAEHPTSHLSQFDNINITEFLLQHRQEIIDLFDVSLDNGDDEE